jgi:hypothetical protein
MIAATPRCDAGGTPFCRLNIAIAKVYLEGNIEI